MRKIAPLLLLALAACQPAPHSAPAKATGAKELGKTVVAQASSAPVAAAEVAAEKVVLPAVNEVAPLAAARYYPGVARPASVLHIEVSESCPECSAHLVNALRQGPEVAVMWHPYIKNSKAPTANIFIDAWCAGRWDVIDAIWKKGVTADKSVPDVSGNPSCRTAIMTARGGQKPNPRTETVAR